MQKLFLLLLLSISCGNLLGQISIKSTPPSFKNSLTNIVPTHRLPDIDTDKLIEEDLFEQKQHKIVPLRFGKDFPTQLNLDNAGIWEQLPNGDQVWRLKITSNNAKSLNFIFDDFYIPKGGELFIYNLDKTYIIGAFTALNNKSYGTFSTAPVKGETVILEYYEPQTIKNQSRLQISSIIHAYRDMFTTANEYIQNLDKGFGDSGNCNVDINCTTGSNWQDEKRAVAMILTSGNTRWCSGVMMNNTLQDTTPYLLTGQHCLDGNANNWVFIFNYESFICSGSDGNLSQSISGSFTRVDYGYTDVALLKLSSKPPSSYLVYYAGWDNSGNNPSESTCIHHPSGDVKKISVDNDPPINGINYNSDHWRVSNWEIGTTEGGSSGSPLFDQNHRVIGQLHGGLAACNNTQYDEFGKLSASWLGGGTFNTQLKHWLDPINSGVSTLDEQYFITANFADNIVIDSIGNISNCGQIQAPNITVKNIGSNPITTLDITYQYANTIPSQTFQWTGNLSWQQTTIIDLPIINVPIGISNLTVTVNIPNVIDEDNTDNTVSKSFNISATDSPIKINLMTDRWPDEISYKIVNSSGNTVHSVSSSQISDPIFENTLITEFLCLPNDCYQAIIEDNFGDGLAGGIGSAPGYFQIITDTTELGISNGNFGLSDTISFCLPNLINTQPIKTTFNIELFPNPVSEMLHFKVVKLPNDIVIYNALGKRVRHFLNPTMSSLNVSFLQNGLYFIEFQYDNQRIIKKFFVVR